MGKGGQLYPFLPVPVYEKTTQAVPRGEGLLDPMSGPLSPCR